MTTSQNNGLAKPTLSNPIHLLAFGFGSGCSPFAPGTMGTLMAVLFYLPLSLLDVSYYAIAVVIISLVGIWICDVAANDLKVHDHPGIVWDEFAGFFITMFAAPSGWLWIVVGFILFRLFDILKPWPISWLDSKVKGGFGIMIDDIIAGIFAWACLQGLVLIV